MSISDRSDARYLPLIRYSDVEGSARWLCNALGFGVQMAVRDTEGVMDYVHLVQGSVNVVIKSRNETGLTATEDGNDAQSRYVFVENVVAHYETAKAEGAEIVIGLQRTRGLGHGYSCRDAEGLIWSFGSFDPWKLANLPQNSEDLATMDVQPEPQPAPLEPIGLDLPLPEPYVRQVRSQPTASRGIFVALLCGGLIGSSIAGAALYYNGASGTTSIERQIAEEQGHRQRSEAAAQQAEKALVQERIAKEQFQSVAKLMEAKLAATQSETAAAEARAQTTQQQLEAQIVELQNEHVQTSTQMSETEKQWRAVQDSLTGELEKAKAAANQAQAERAELETVMTARVFSIEADLHKEQGLRQAAEAAKAAAETQLSDERRNRQRAEAALKTAMANLNTERQARVEAEQRADKLAARLSVRRPTGNVARAKQPVRAKPAVARAKQPVAKQPVVKKKVIAADTVLDIGFQP